MAVALKGVPVPTGIECIAERPDGTRFWFTPCPAVVRDGRYVAPVEAGNSMEMRADSIRQYSYPDGPAWAALRS